MPQDLSPGETAEISLRIKAPTNGVGTVEITCSQSITLSPAVTAVTRPSCTRTFVAGVPYQYLEIRGGQLDIEKVALVSPREPTTLQITVKQQAG